MHEYVCNLFVGCGLCTHQFAENTYDNSSLRGFTKLLTSLRVLVSFIIIVACYLCCPAHKKYGVLIFYYFFVLSCHLVGSLCISMFCMTLILFTIIWFNTCIICDCTIYLDIFTYFLQNVVARLLLLHPTFNYFYNSLQSVIWRRTVGSCTI